MSDENVHRVDVRFEDALDTLARKLGADVVTLMADPEPTPKALIGHRFRPGATPN
jgi:hypothetical protein